MRSLVIKHITAPLLLLATCAIVNAQKLPNVQQKSLRAPANVKVDGKATEWDDTFQAYNHATDIFYSMANDDDKLYLVVQASDKQIINKIIGGGVELTIQKSGKKNDKDGITITYPLFDPKDRPYVGGGGGAIKMMSFTTGGGGGESMRTIDVKGDNGSPAASAQVKGSAGPSEASRITEGDSIMNVYNKRLSDKSKYIGVNGIPGLDTLISVYNEDGIKVGERFNPKMVYTWELAIDLKRFGLSVSDGSKFAYHIKLNGAKMGTPRIIINGSPAATNDPAMQEKIQAMMSQIRISGPGGDPTDFWGEYTLAKQ